MLDATASIGLEADHELADVIGYSSCKGLFGLTGAAFIAYNQEPKVEVNSFYLNINSHINRNMTGPYHAIYCFKIHEDIKHSVKIKNWIVWNLQLSRRISPLLCTLQIAKLFQIPIKQFFIMKGSEKQIVCHLGRLPAKAQGK